MSSRTITVATDVAALFLFEPAELAHRGDDPIAWYAYDFAYQAESRAGRLVAVATGSDGVYAVRLTTGALTDREAAHRGRGFEFPLVVRHGRVLLDSSDALPGAEQQVKPEEIEDCWFDLPGGSYRVAIHPIDWASESGASDADRSADDMAPPDYVVTFAAVEDAAAIAISTTMPVLKPQRTWQPTLAAPQRNDAGFLWAGETPSPATYPLLEVDAATFVLPGQTISVEVASTLAEAFTDRTGAGPRERVQRYVIAPAAVPGALAMVAEPTGVSQRRGFSPRMRLCGRDIAHIGDVRQEGGGRQIAVVPVARPDMQASPDVIARFKSVLLEHAEIVQTLRARLDHPAFELERFAALRSGEAVTAWALRYLDMTPAHRLDCYALGTSERIRRLTALLEGRAD
jgi:hypothetical protein